MNNLSAFHELKTWPEEFKDVKFGKKTFDVRPNDRNFSVGDEILLKEFVPAKYISEQQDSYFTGQICHRKISYILQGGQFGIEKGFVVLGLEKI